MPINPRESYAAAWIVLELEGVSVGFLKSAKGGEPFATVVGDQPDRQGMVNKHVGEVRYEPIMLELSPELDPTLLQWISEFLENRAAPKDGAIFFSNYSLTDSTRIEFRNAQISALAIPALDARSKDLGFISLTLQPESTRVNENSVAGRQPNLSSTKRTWSTSGFRFAIDSLENVCAKSDLIDSICVTRIPGTGKGVVNEENSEMSDASVNVSNLVFTLNYGDARDVINWVEEFLMQGLNDDGYERSGSLELLDPRLDLALLNINFYNLGVVRASRINEEVGHAVVSRVRVELYCERMSISRSADEDYASKAGVEPAKSTDDRGDFRARAFITTDLKFVSTDPTRFNAKGLGGSVLSEIKKEAATSEAIAQRLLETARLAKPAAAVSKRQRGTALGREWAAEMATIEELQLIANVHQDEWSSLKMFPGSTLMDFLRNQGIFPADFDDPSHLERDEFVEGLVVGAAQVLTEVTPHLAGVLNTAQ